MFGSTDANVAILLRLLRQEGDELARRHDWQALVVQQTFVSVAAEAQPAALPSDYDRLMPDARLWDRTSNFIVSGPTGSRAWLQIHGAGYGGVTGWWRLISGVLNIYPAPAAGRTYALEYVSRNWAASSGGTAKSTFEADTDVGRIPERLMTLGLIWRWRHAKGLDYAEDMRTYEREMERASARDRGLAIITPPGGSRRGGGDIWGVPGGTITADDGSVVNIE